MKENFSESFFLYISVLWTQNTMYFERHQNKRRVRLGLGLGLGELGLQVNRVNVKENIFVFLNTVLPVGGKGNI